MCCMHDPMHSIIFGRARLFLILMITCDVQKLKDKSNFLILRWNKIIETTRSHLFNYVCTRTNIIFLNLKIIQFKAYIN